MSKNPTEAPYFVWLDDTRPEPDGWFRAYWPDEIYPLLLNNQVLAMSLDHDLGDDDRGTGYTLMRWLEERVALGEVKVLPAIRIHSANPTGRSNMHRAIESCRRFAKENNIVDLHDTQPTPSPRKPAL